MSTIPAALNALVAAFSAEPDLSEVQVWDGQPVSTLAPDVLVVGYSADEPGVQGPLEDKLQGQRESYEVVCLASSWRGDTETQQVRDIAFGILAAVRTTLSADTTLGGAVARTHVTAREVDQAQVRKGASVTIKFTIHVDAFLR